MINENYIQWLSEVEKRYPDKVAPAGTPRLLAEEFGVTEKTVRNALNKLEIKLKWQPRKMKWSLDETMNYIHKNWPDGVLPEGTISSLAKAHGVSRQRMHQLVVKAGARGTKKINPTEKQCEQGHTYGYKRRRCPECTTPTYTCSFCSKSFKRNISLVRRAQKTLKSPINVYCSRACFASRKSGIDI